MDLLFVILYKLIQYYRYVIVIHIILSWFPQIRQSGFGRLIGRLSEPYLEPFRRIVPSIGMFDFSPIIALFALEFAGYGIASISHYF
ncbi:YggT family protein [Gottfriedia acidiceleris]|uniref:YggT family protein n=1 Tax=Gottfriedia acidiceleris TaxID=371036 RepID=A0ABY4JH29_9BACI|nr:YggT family protein [Gottfriedia acidiceleris]UPM53131.1 YggT family protein [Gottfriedia acidiceleris]